MRTRTRVQVCEALDGSCIAIWWQGERRRATVTVHERADGTVVRICVMDAVIEDLIWAEADRQTGGA